MFGQFGVVMFVATAASLGLAVLAWRSRSRPGGTPLLALMLAIAGWSGTLFLATVTPGYGGSVFWMHLHFLPLTLVIPTLVWLILEYGGREDLLTRWTAAALLVEPVVANVLVWTHDYHDLFLEYAPISEVSAGDIAPGSSAAAFAPIGAVPVDVGPGFWVHAIYNWGMAVLIFLVLLGWIAQRRSLYRRQLGLVALGLLVSLVASILDNVVALGVRLTEPSFVVMGGLLTIAVVRYDFANVAPIARSTVLEEMGTAVIVVDDVKRVVEINERGRRLLGADDVIGRNIRSVLSAAPDVSDRFEGVRDGSETIVVDTPEGTRHLRVEVTPLTGRRDRFLGRVFLVHDITEQRTQRVQLERQNERLERFASLVSHDLRNPLQVADASLELAREADDPDPHHDRIADSHRRMDTIIDDVLELARQGQSTTETEPVDLASLADAAWESVDTGDATLRNDLTGSVDADPPRLQRVFENLFRNAVEHGSTSPPSQTQENAVEHAESAPTVTVGLLSNPEGALVDLDRQGFFVADDGPGVPEDDREAVFEWGYSEGGGTGLGLAIVRSIVEAHGWEVTAVEGPNGGARFEVTGVSSLRPPGNEPDGDAGGDGDADSDDGSRA